MIINTVKHSGDDKTKTNVTFLQTLPKLTLQTLKVVSCYLLLISTPGQFFKTT